MSATVCPWGSEARPGAPAYVQIDSDLLTSVFGDLFGLLIGYTHIYLGQYVDIVALCALPRPTDYELDWPDDLIQELLGEKLYRRIEAYLWDQYAQCKTPPLGCGTEFDEENPGFLVLNEINATPVSTGDPDAAVERINSWYAGWTAGSPVSDVFNNAQVGDFVYIVALTNTGTPANVPDGFTDILSSPGTNTSLRAFYRVKDGTEGNAVTVTHADGSCMFYWFIYRNVDAAKSAASAVAAVVASGTYAQTEDLAVPNAHCAGVAVSLIRWDGLTATEVAPWVGSPEVSGPQATGAFSFAENTGAGTLTGHALDWNDTYEVNALNILLEAPGASGGEYWRWEDATAVAYGGGVNTTPYDPQPQYELLVLTPGYYIELRFPVEYGGTEADGYNRVSWYDYAHTLIDVTEIAYDGVLNVYVWPCYYIPEWDEPEPDIGDYEPPLDPPAASLEGLADAVYQLELKLNRLLSRLDVTTDLIEDMYGPHTATVGQAQEQVSGHLGVFMRDALTAMSNYHQSGWVETLIMAGITGDHETLASYPAYRVRLTQVPGNAAWRGEGLRLYEVNSRAQQLGWVQFLTAGAYLDSLLLVSDNQVVVAPVEAPAGIHLYLRPGVVATLYGLVPVWSPTLP